MTTDGGPTPREARRNLDKIDHIVVLMMENRSFDHMLGYLSLEGVVRGLDGLEPGMGNRDRKGRFHAVAPLGDRLINEKVLDPGHSVGEVARQVDHRNGGFVTSYEYTLESNKKRFPYSSGVVFDPTLVLGYLRADDTPVYDYLARTFTVCDRWFSSVPGPTWRNRMYAMTGAEGKPTPPRILGIVPNFLRNVPMYDRPAFVRWLDADDWRWYSYDPATLRVADSAYRPGGATGHDADANFAYFNRRTLFEQETFLDDAADGRLPAVSWVDPNFVDFRLFGPPGSNDDHPPAAVMLGQELVLTLIFALMESSHWKRCALVITYDEHGGFYDHVVPADHPIPGDSGRRYGVRVPALVVSPFAPAGVSHVVFDHTSIIKTMFLRFSKRADEGLAAMGPRTQAANHLGSVLTADAPREPADPAVLQALADRIARWKIDVHASQLLERPTPREQIYEAVTDLQRDIIGNAMSLRQRGLPPGQP